MFKTPAADYAVPITMYFIWNTHTHTHTSERINTCLSFLLLLVLLSIIGWEGYSWFFCSVDRASLYNLFQMKPTRCTLLLSIFISTSLHVSGNYVPIIRITYCIYATLVFFTLYGWLSGLLIGMRPQPADQTATHTEWKIPVSHR